MSYNMNDLFLFSDLQYLLNSLNKDTTLFTSFTYWITLLFILLNLL